MRLRVTEIADVVGNRLEDQDHPRDAVGQTVREHNGGGSRTVGERKDSHMPTGS